MNIYKTIIATVAAGSVCTALTSNAALSGPLTPGAPGVAPVTAVSPLGGVLQGSLFSTYSFGGGIDTGTILTQAFSGVSQNTLGGLTFQYTITVLTGDLSSVALNVFNVPSVLVGTLSGGDQATSANFTLGNVVNFTWNTDTVPTTSPVTVLVGTGINQFQSGVVTLEDNFPDGSAGILVPVPEPTTVLAGALMLLPLGIGAVRSLRKERA